jgi:Tol biopolymer transport system component
MNPDGSNQQRITSHAGGEWTDADEDPVWSKDAKKIVFTSWRDGLNELFIVNADGTGESRLTGRDTSWNDFPSWSPDGSKIAFVSYRTGQTQIYIMNADGSNQTRVTYATIPSSSDVLSFRYPSWSPDGSKIVCDTHWAGSDDAGGIYVFSVNTGNYTQLTHSGDDYNAVWSPDGSKIAFYRHASNNTSGDIYVMNSNGSGLTRLTEGIVPAWSPDGSKIAFVRLANGGRLWVINTDGSGEKNLIPSTLGQTPIPDWTPSWSPDGKKLLLVYNGEIYLVNADGSGLTKVTTNAKSGIGPVWSPK